MILWWGSIQKITMVGSNYTLLRQECQRPAGENHKISNMYIVVTIYYSIDKISLSAKLTLQQYGSCWLWWNTAKNGKFRKMAEALCCPSLVSSTFCRSAQSLICIHRFACPRHLRPDTQFSVLCCQDWSPVTATGAGSPSVTETSSGKTLELQTVHRFSQ